MQTSIPKSLIILQKKKKNAAQYALFNTNQNRTETENVTHQDTLGK
jgi:hypothetical protein